MPRSAASHPFDAFIHSLANAIADRFGSAVARPKPSRAPGGASANERRRQSMLGRQLDMSCRVAGCKNRSSGPGRGYMCEQHQKLPKKDQLAAREAWKAKHAA